MSTLSDFGSGLKSGGAAPFTQGIAQGASLMMNIDQMAQQRREKEWARDLTLVKTYVDYAGTKGVSKETSATSINKANQIIQKWYPQMELPQVTPEAMPNYAPILKQGAALIDNLGKDPSKFEFVIGEWGKLNAGWDAENMKKAELSDMEKTARANVHDTLKTMGAAKGKDGSGGADSPSKIKAEIQRKYMADPASLSQQEQVLIAEDLQDPAFKLALQAYGQNLMNLSNKPEEQLAVLNTMTKTIRTALDQQAAVANPPPKPVDAAQGAGDGAQLPPEAITALQQANGQPVTFKNGQTWTIENGAPKRVK